MPFSAGTALATDIAQQLAAAGLATSANVHDVVKAILDAKFGAAASA